MTPKQYDAAILLALEKADEYLYMAWKHSECKSDAYRRINEAQILVQGAILALKDGK